MQYKALMSDIDGTLLPYDYDSMPTEKVREAIKEAEKILPVCLATGRSYAFTEPVLNALNLHKGYVVVNNGAQVLSLEDRSVVYERTLEREAIEQVVAYFQKEKVPVAFSEHLGRSVPYHGQKISGVSKFFIEEVYSAEKIDEMITALSHIPSIVIFKSHHKDAGAFGINIMHAEATKQHGIQQVAELLGITTHDMIGIGDGYNDFPLLMACGLKVAMGNAVEDLKAIADYIAPPVTEDGAAVMIEKYILKKD